MKRVGLIVAGLTLLLLACDHSGLSKEFRKVVEKKAVIALAQADDSPPGASLAAVDAALAEAKPLMQTATDVRMAEVLDWYSILLRRRDRERTKVWRQLCAREVQLYLSGDPSGSVRIGEEDRRVDRGACQATVFQMMTEDCIAAGRPAEECTALTGK